MYTKYTKITPWTTPGHDVSHVDRAACGRVWRCGQSSPDLAVHRGTGVRLYTANRKKYKKSSRRLLKKTSFQEDS